MTAGLIMQAHPRVGDVHVECLGVNVCGRDMLLPHLCTKQLNVANNETMAHIVLMHNTFRKLVYMRPKGIAEGALVHVRNIVVKHRADMEEDVLCRNANPIEFPKLHSKLQRFRAAKAASESGTNTPNTALEQNRRSSAA